ncbi:hypothetical protein F5Y15DRAFT_412027 [Xylariaceae sp. FL0016]|nr:hypothetical protein F5Y15DRAFT_412027 [Xylariaceae sp. FL0016]
MSSSSKPVSVVLIGLSTEIGRPVTEGLLPEYEVIRFIQSEEAARADLPHIFEGREPPAPSTNDVGSGHYGQTPRVVIVGRAFEPEKVEAIRQSCAGSIGAPTVWVVGDPARKPAGVPPPGYGQKLPGELKKIISGWYEAGAEKDDMILY